MASKGGYLGGSTIIRVHQKRSKTSESKQNRKRNDNAKLAADYAAYTAKLESPVQSVGPSRAAPSKASEKNSNRILKELEPVINRLRQLACEFTKITGEPSNLVHDLAIYQVQSMKNIIGVRRGLAGFDGWRRKMRVLAVGGMVPQSSKDAMTKPVTIYELDKEWDELCLVLFNGTYGTNSIYRVAKGELCDVIGQIGWKDGSPTFVLPLSIIVELSSFVSGNRLNQNGRTIVEGCARGGVGRSTL